MIACLLTGGPDHVIEVNGVKERFEDHLRLGPCPTTKTGKERTLGPRHAFWTAVTQWYAGDKKMRADGLCEWAPEPDPRIGMVRVGKNAWAPPEMVAELAERLRKERP